MISPSSGVEDSKNAAALPAARRGALLVVDDEDGPRQSMRVIFKEEFDMFAASDGPSAIELAQKNKIDVAVLDIRMGGMSGIEVLERLKYVDPNIEVIMMTAFETADTMRQALRLRASDYINKPFDIATMRVAVRKAMERRVLASEIHSDAKQTQELLAELQSHKVEEQIAQTRGDIYASIIHDINGPLTVISGFIQLMNQRIGNATQLPVEDLEFIKDRLKTINRQVTNCIEISRRYLSFLRRQTDENSRVAVNQLLTDLQELVRVHPAAQHHEFTVQKLTQDVAAKINGTDLIQILLNLAVNGFQCSNNEHAVHITSKSLSEPLDVKRFKDGNSEHFLNRDGFQNTAPLLSFAVSDDGPGIPPEIFPKIFDPYFTTKGARQGTGLGLNIVQRLIKEAGGAIRVTTKPGSGTTFTVYLRAMPLEG